LIIICKVLKILHTEKTSGLSCPALTECYFNMAQKNHPYFTEVVSNRYFK